MMENRYYKGQDLRAVENPYEASFELAEKFGGLSGSLKMSLKVLIAIFIYYSVIIIVIIIFNLLYGSNRDLNLFSVAFSMFMLGLTLFTLKRLFESHTFLKDLGFNQSLMNKIKMKVEEGKFDVNGEKDLKVHDDPIKGLIGLIQSTSKYSKNIARTFQLIIGFIMVWYLAGILYLSIQMYRFGFDLNRWTFDWLLPGGVDITVAVIATILIIMVREKFEFSRKRYDAIDYAMALSPPAIPKADSPVKRYKEYLTCQNGYEDLKQQDLWKKGPYFDGELDTNTGKVLVKYLNTTPKMENLKKFREMVMENTGSNRLDRTVIIYKEDPNLPLSDKIYQNVLEYPIKIGKEICNIQLVVEGEDGKYDFIPIVSF